MAVHAEENDPAPNPERLLDSGRAFQKWAEDAPNPSVAVENFQKAIEQYRMAIQARPDYYRAHALWAHCLHQLCLRVTDAQQRRVLAQAAAERFAQAARCPGVEWNLYHEWGSLLSYQVEKFTTDRAQRSTLLTAGRKAYEQALELTRFSGERAKVERDLGMCLLLLGEEDTDPAKQRKYLTEAISRFESATRVEAQAQTARIYGLWGVALLRLARLNSNDRMMIRQGIERLQTSLEKAPDNLEMRYNLACAYALLNQPENALRHLRLCLENDDARRTYFNAAAQDPDLNALRSTAEYNQIFGQQPAPSGTFIKPGLSDR